MTAPLAGLRHHAARAGRYFVPEVNLGIGALLAAVLIASGVSIVSSVHTARRHAAEACRVAVRAEFARNPMLDRAVLPAEPCRALRVLRGQDA